MSYETLSLTRPSPGVALVELNRPDSLNAMNQAFFRELRSCFEALSLDSETRCIVLAAKGRLFSAGLDLNAFMGEAMGGGGDGDGDGDGDGEELDVARKAWRARTLVGHLQDCVSAVEKCSKPIIAAVHGGCVGGGVDLICCCDLRMASADAWFCIKEVDIGIAADLGTLQRIPKIMGNQSLINDMALTARRVPSEELLRHGFVSEVHADRGAMVEAALAKAAMIAEKSPVAVVSTKEILKYARDHSVEDGLNYVNVWNMSMSQTKDQVEAVFANLGKTKPTFSKL